MVSQIRLWNKRQCNILHVAFWIIIIPGFVGQIKGQSGGGCIRRQQLRSVRTTPASKKNNAIWCIPASVSLAVLGEIVAGGPLSTGKLSAGCPDIVIEPSTREESRLAVLLSRLWQVWQWTSGPVLTDNLYRCQGLPLTIIIIFTTRYNNTWKELSYLLNLNTKKQQTRQRY